MTALVLLGGVLYVLEPVPIDSHFILAVPFVVTVLVGAVFIVRRRHAFGISVLIGTVVWPLSIMWSWSRNPIGS